MQYCALSGRGEFDSGTRGDALRACPWLSYSAPSALDYLYARLLRQTQHDPMRYVRYVVIAALIVTTCTIAIGQEAAKVVADGISAFEHGDKTKAKLLFERALKADRRNVDAHTYLGMLAADANELKEAEQHFASAASPARPQPCIRNTYGAILMRRGRTAQACTEFEA